MMRPFALGSSTLAAIAGPAARANRTATPNTDISFLNRLDSFLENKLLRPQTRRGIPPPNG